MADEGSELAGMEVEEGETGTTGAREGRQHWRPAASTPVQLKVKLYEGASVSLPFVRALGKLGVGWRIAGDPRGKQVPEEAGEGEDEEVIVAARVPWQEGAQGEGEGMTCMARIRQAIAVKATTVVLIVAPELVWGDAEYDMACDEWHSQGQGGGKKESGLTVVSDARERALEAGLELITTCFLRRAAHKEVACLVWERKSADSRRLPGLVVSLEEGEQVKAWGQLRPAHLIEGEQGMEHNYVGKTAAGSRGTVGGEVVGCRLHTVALGAGRVVATSEWRGSAIKDSQNLRLVRLDGTKVENMFGCCEVEGQVQLQVRAEDFRWVPLGAGEWDQLRPGHMVVAEGQLQWRKLLEKVSDTEYRVSVMCSGKVKYAAMGLEEVVAVKVQRLPVHSIEGVWSDTRQGKGQRRWDSIWILDSREGVARVRMLYGEEIWGLYGLWPESLSSLEREGWSTQDCGRLAAGEVAQCMVDAVMGCVVRRLKLKLRAEEEGKDEYAIPWLIPEAPRATRVRVSLLVVRLAESSGGSPLILCCKGREGSWMVGGELPAGRSAGEGCLVRARLWAEQLVTKVSEPFQHSRDPGKDRTDVICLVPYSSELKAEQEAFYTWRTLEELGGGGVFMLAANAVSLAWTFMGRGVATPGGGGGVEGSEGEKERWVRAQERVLFTSCRSGKLQAGLVDRGMKMMGPSRSWEDLTRLDAQARGNLKAAMARARLDLDAQEGQALSQWEDRITPINSLDLAEGVLGEWFDFEQECLSRLEYVVRCVQAPSARLPQVEAQRSPSGDFQPQSTEELFEPWAWQRLQAWISKQLVFLRDIREKGMDAVRHSNETLALGNRALVEAARGFLWDCRGGRPVLLDLGHVESSHINFGLLVKEGESWGLDHELTDMFRFGFSYKADLELQVVGCPHLISLRENYVRMVKDTRAMASGGETSRFFEVSDHIQFVPCRFGSKGSAKKDGYYLDGTAKRRPTNEGGAPRKPTYDTDGIPVRPINVATEETTSHPEESAYPKWAHENKPRMSDAMKAIAVLKHLAWLLAMDWEVYMFGDDCACFFNQFRTRTAQWPFTTFLMDDEQFNAQFVLEKGMTFGPSKASQLAQRIANFIIEMFCQRMDKADEPFVRKEAESNPALRAWLLERGTQEGGKWKWATQCRLYAAFMYTDDPFFVCLGADRLVRMLVVWEGLTQELGLIMNKDKRGVGTHLVWLGFNILATPGMLCITKKKVVKLTLQIAAAIDGTLLLSDYRSMMGSLEHILFATSRDRAQMLGLWRPLRGEWEPNNRVRLDDAQKQLMRWWMGFVAGVGGVSAGRAVTETLEQRVREATQGVLTATSDAYSEPGGQGMGVYMHGLYTWYDVPRHLQGLHITALEFLAGLLAVKTCSGVVEAAGGRIVLHMRLDAITACYALTEKSEKSEILQAVHQVLLRMPEFIAIRRWVAISHIAGLSNVFADMASRPVKRHLMFRLAAVMGVELTKVEPPTEWLEEVIEELLRVGRAEEEVVIQGPTWSPKYVSPPGQHADTPHFAARGETVSNNDNKASRVKTTFSKREEHAERMARMARVGVFLARKCSRAPDELEVGRSVRKVRDLSPTYSGECHLTDRMAERMARMARIDAFLDGKGKSKALKEQRVEQPVQKVRDLSSAGSKEFHLTDRMVSMLEKDTSHYAIAKTGAMRDSIRVSFDLRMLGRNDATQRQQRGQWKHWVRFCEAQGICPTRDDHDANSGKDRIGHMREVELLNSALCFYMGLAKGRGRVAALPKAGMNWLRGVRRVHEQMMPKVVMVPMKAVQECYDGLMRQYQQKWTVAATLPVRKEPLTNSDINRLVKLWWDPASDGTKVGKQVVRTGSALTVVLGCIWLLLLDTGMRLAEVTSNKWDLTCCSRASVSFMVKGVLYRSLTRLQLMGMREGDYVIVTPPPSKKDPHGVIWGCKPVWLDFRRDEMGCAARALRDLELVLPIDEGKRASTPLFVDGAGRCVKGSFVRRVFKDSILTFKSKRDAKKLSTHSFRITLGCKLKAAGCSDSVIMAMCRWQSLKSLEVYCRLTPEDYAGTLRKARQADAKSVQVTSLPALGEQLDEEPQEGEADSDYSSEEGEEDEEQEV